MNILAIETSCDDTCVAILKVKENKFPNFKILSNIVSSQIKIHKKWGGVYPFLAKREHQRNLPIIFKKAFKKAKNPKIHLIAVTVGPGLEPCLWVGVNFAKKIAKDLKLPIIPVNHIEAHIIANFVGKNSKFEIQNSKLFPAICLVVSGGHTQLILMKEFGDYKILGETRDDAAGECLDKTARILGLDYPGGPAIAREASKFQKVIPDKKQAVADFLPKLPRPMIYQKNYDFSFSGLKTAVLYHYKKQSEKIRKSKRYLQALAAEIQQAVIDVLIYKTLKAAKDFNAKTIILGGGVTANEELRKQFRLNIKSQISKVKFLVPAKNFSTDNAAMVAVAGYYHWLKGERERWEDIEVNANLRLK